MKTQRSLFSRWERWVAVPFFCCALVLSFASLAHGELYDDCDGDVDEDCGTPEAGGDADGSGGGSGSDGCAAGRGAAGASWAWLLLAGTAGIMLLRRRRRA